MRSNRTLTSLNNCTTASSIKSSTSLGSFASLTSSREATSERPCLSLALLAAAITTAYCKIPANMTARRCVRPSGTSSRTMRTHTSDVSAPTTPLKLRLFSFAGALLNFHIRCSNLRTRSRGQWARNDIKIKTCAFIPSRSSYLGRGRCHVLADERLRIDSPAPANNANHQRLD